VLLEMLFSVLISQSTTQGLQKVWRIVFGLTVKKRLKMKNVFLQFVNIIENNTCSQLGQK